MERILRPDRFDTDPNSSTATREWKHWFKTFSNYLESIADHNPNQLNVLVNYLTPRVYDYISECTSYDGAILILSELYVKPKNEVFARHLLATRQQKPGETLDEFLQALKSLSTDCNFKTVSAQQHKEEFIRDAFISGLRSQQIRQRLLENKTLELSAAFDQARALDAAQQSLESYSSPPFTAAAASSEASAATPGGQRHDGQLPGDSQVSASAASDQKCFFCGRKRHPRNVCPARNVTCMNCGKKGHYQTVCRSPAATTPASHAILLAASSAGLSRATVTAVIQGHELQALVDTGSTESFISEKCVSDLKLSVHQCKPTKVSMAATSLSTAISGCCIETLSVQDRMYADVKLSVLPYLCSDLILGHDFLKQHEKVTVDFGGSEPPLNLCGLNVLDVSPPSLFENLTPNCVPVATKSRRYSEEDQAFIHSETERLLAEGVIEPSSSPWRAQVVVTVNERHKKRMVIDYSQTINRFTLLDAYPLPRIDDVVNKVAKYRHFSTIDLKSAYHQIPIRESDKVYTAFQSGHNLYQFRRLPFGVTNGVACFQRVMDDFIRDNCLEGTFVYLDDVTVCGKTKEEHDANLQRFLDAAKRYNLTLNDDKCVYSVSTIRLLGYCISDGEIRPDPERLEPLKALPLPQDTKALRRAVGMFSYYSQWISKFSEKIRPLTGATSFPLGADARDAFAAMKGEIEKSVVRSIDEGVPFVMETDASDVALAATLTQAGRPVAFFSRTLNPIELKYAAVEKEAHAIVEGIRKWRHYLAAHHFTIVTDQKSVAFMFNQTHPGKIKNDKIQRWRLELSSFDFDIVYRPGRDNIPADTLSRASLCSSMGTHRLAELHNALCHPGVTRLTHFVRSRNLPFSVEDVKRVTSSCPVCAECKPQYYRPPASHLIKATHPFERLNIDFKGPLPTSSRNRYLLTIVDEYSRFPFAFPCPDMTTQTVITCLTELFSVFGMPAYVHSDRGTSFMSSELREFLTSRGVAVSRTTPYNPQGNGQCERYNGIIWLAITLALKSRKLPVTRWETVLTDVLHSIRTLLCTATNCTPHERMFNFQRRSTSGHSLPSWLSAPGKVLLKKHVRSSKFDPTVDEVDLLEANSQYAHVRLPSGRETTVSVRDLAPPGDAVSVLSDSEDAPLHLDPGAEPVQTPHEQPDPEPRSPHVERGCGLRGESNEGRYPPLTDIADPCPAGTRDDMSVKPVPDSGLRRSVRDRRAPDRLNL